MFTTNEYRILFKRRWHRRQKMVIDGEPLIDCDGRYDTICEIWHRETSTEVPVFTSIAILHPNDKADKITGKKVALCNAMIDCVAHERGKKIIVYNPPFKSKGVRNEVWEDFKEWVASWGVKDEE